MVRKRLHSKKKDISFRGFLWTKENANVLWFDELKREDVDLVGENHLHLVN